MVSFIEPYNLEWKTEFEKLKLLLEAALSGFEIDIQHVGSTCVPGLMAKPILDVDIIIDNKLLLGGIADRLEAMGYRNEGDKGVVGRYAFRQKSEFTPITLPQRKWQSHHLYVCFSDSLALKNHLLFRAALLRDKGLVGQYALLKRALSEERGITREEYAKRKTEFVLSVLKSSGLEPSELNEIRDANR